jgi:predicted alpha/beta superfamily hydrolase
LLSPTTSATTAAYGAFSDDGVEVEVELVVRLAEAAETDGPLYVAGNLSALGTWKPDATQLQLSMPGTWTARFTAAAGTMAEFKITRGTWGTVEKTAAGRDIPNRTFRVELPESGARQRIEVRVERWGAPAVRNSTVTGELVLHREFASRHVGATRTLAVWLPPGYAASDERYPVFYLQDGQNLFDAATAAFGVEWQVDETLTQLIAAGRIPPLIVVGIGNSPQRLDEYTPTRDQRLQRGGGADAYLKAVVEEIKPHIDRTYRTRPEREFTAIGGSSLGGLLALYACQQYPEHFSRCAALSPSLHWDDEALLKEWQQPGPWIARTRIWFDMGTLEGGGEASQKANVERTRRLAEQLAAAGSQRGRDFQYREVDGGRHHEAAWAERFGQVLEFFYAEP